MGRAVRAGRFVVGPTVLISNSASGNTARSSRRAAESANILAQRAQQLRGSSVAEEPDVDALVFTV